jgi:Cu/Ag efflux protein CusF
MKRLAIALVLLVANTAAANTYLDNGKTATQDCAKDPEAIIVGNENTITFTGTCSKITAAGNENKLKIASVKRLDVQGNKNTVDADEVDAINAPGNRNTVVWKKGIAAKTPKVSSPGTGNKISAAK